MNHRDLLLLILVAALYAPAAQAQDAVAAFYKGRQINLIVGSSAGGGYDTYARLLGRHLGKYIPGNPVIVPSNMPGAGSNATVDYYVCVVRADAPVKNFRDALSREVIIGASQPGTSTRDFPALLNNAVG